MMTPILPEIVPVHVMRDVVKEAKVLALEHNVDLYVIHFEDQKDQSEWFFIDGNTNRFFWPDFTQLEGWQKQIRQLFKEAKVHRDVKTSIKEIQELDV